MNKPSCEQTSMLRDIGMIDFTLTELTLYLDTHPHDKQAMDYFNHYSHIKKQLVKDFSSRYYPLMAEASTETRDWKWALAPMPWENLTADNVKTEGGCK